MSYTNIACKKAAAHLREHLRKHHNIKLGSGRAHELVASVLDFNSAAELKTFPHECLNPNYPDEFYGLEGNGGRVEQRLMGLSKKVPELQALASRSNAIAEVIAQGLRPPCDYCGSLYDSHRIEGREGGDDTTWICTICLGHPNTQDVATCRYCEPDSNIYPTEALSKQGLCPDHRDELGMEPEERAGWEDYIENLTKDG